MVDIYITESVAMVLYNLCKEFAQQHLNSFAKFLVNLITWIQRESEK